MHHISLHVKAVIEFTKSGQTYDGRYKGMSMAALVEEGSKEVAKTNVTVDDVDNDKLKFDNDSDRVIIQF